MCLRSRLKKTRGDRGRSSGLPVSFSTIEASVTISKGEASGRSDARPSPDRIDQLLLVALHFLQKLVAPVAAMELVGLRQQRAFARNFADVAGQEVVLAQALDDLARWSGPREW